MFSKRLSPKLISRIAVIALTVAMLVSSQSTVTNAQQGPVTLNRDDPKLVTFYIHDDDLPNGDPQLAGSTISVRWVENTFIGLTDLSADAGQVKPAYATSWSVSSDGLTWTLKLRSDIPWVSFDPDTQVAKVERMVTAQDVVTGTRRACDNTLGGSYGPVTAEFIAGCSAVLASKAPTQDLFNGVGVKAVDDNTVQFTLTAPTGFFPIVASLWTLRPVPGELISKFGPDWIKPGNAWYSGPYLTDTFKQGVGRTLIRNPFFPKDLRGPGNVDRVDLIVLTDGSTLLSDYLKGQLDMVRDGSLNGGDIPSLVSNASLKGQLTFINGTGLDYVSFNEGKPPFDNVYVRRAFSAALDRKQMIQDAAGGLGVPMIHITPPMMTGAPPIDQVGVGFDPKYAVEQLAMSPYPGCKGFPEVSSISQSGRRTLYAQFSIKAWSTILGCDPSLFKNEEFKSFSDMIPIMSTSNDMAKRPNWHEDGWGPDYPDANNYVGDILGCKTDNGFTSRPCSAVDDLILKARIESDPAKRSALYAQIEDMYFGKDGIVPAAPIRLSATYGLYQTYLTGPFETDGQVGGEHWDYYTIDKAAQDAVRNKK